MEKTERAAWDTAETLIAQLHVVRHSTSLRLVINWRQLKIPERLLELKNAAETSHDLLTRRFDVIACWLLLFEPLESTQQNAYLSRQQKNSFRRHTRESMTHPQSQSGSCDIIGSHDISGKEWNTILCFLKGLRDALLFYFFVSKFLVFFFSFLWGHLCATFSNNFLINSTSLRSICVTNVKLRTTAHNF